MESFRPSLQEVSTRIQSDIASQLNIQLPLKKVSILSALSFALAGAVHLLYGRVEYLITQFFNPTARFLDTFCFFFGIQRHEKTASRATIKFTGAAGKSVGKDVLLSHPDGRTYKLNAAVSISDSGFVFGTVKAQTLGPSGTLKPGDTLTLIESVANVSLTTQVLTDNLVPGFEEESDDELKARLFARLRHPGQGGSKQDYIQWAKETAGVGNVWVTSEPNVLQVFVTFLTTESDHPIPTPEHIKQVSDSFLERKPLGTRVSVYGLTPIAIPIDLSLSPELTSLVPRIETALKAFFLKQAAPDTKISLFALSQVVSRVTRTGNFKIASPINDIEIGEGQIGVYGGLSWKTIALF